MMRELAFAVTMALLLSITHSTADREMRDDERLLDVLHELPWRPLEAALDQDLPHRPYRRVAGVENLTLLAATNAVAAQTAASPRMRGLAFILRGDTSSALDVLRTAAVNSKDPSIWNEVAAASLVAADRDDSGEDAVDALSATGRALALDSAFAPAHFNRVLAFRRLGLMREAAAEARDLLQQNPESAWAAEAVRISERAGVVVVEPWKRELPRLENAIAAGTHNEACAIIRRNAQPARTWGEGVILGNWADAIVAGDTERAKKQLRVAQAIGEELKAFTGESLLADAAAAAANSSDVMLLATAHRTYRAGRIAHTNVQNEAAEADFRRAAVAFARAGSPMALVARYYLGSSLYVQYRTSEAATVLDELVAEQPQAHGYLALAAQIGWERGLCDMITGSYSSAIERLDQSQQTFAKLHENENAASFDALAAEALDFVSDPADSWRRRRRAFEGLAASGNELRKVVALTAAAGDRARREEWSRALALLDVAVDGAVRLENPQLATSALTQRALVRARSGEVHGTATDIREARIWIERLPDRAARGRAVADLDFANGIAAANANAAIAHLDRAIAYYAEAAPSYLPPILLERARAHRRRGDPAAAARDLDEGIHALERWRSDVRDLAQRAEMFAASQGLFQEAESLAIADGDSRELFDLVERSSARAILDSLGLAREAMTPIPLGVVERVLARDAAIVVFFSCDRRLRALVVRAAGTSFVDLGDVDAIAAQARSIRDAMFTASGPEAMRAAGELHEIVIAPILPLLNGTRLISFVPEATLRGVPFHALYDRTRDRFLIEDFAVTESPSATIAVMLSKRAGITSDDNLVAIGATSFDRARFPRLDALPTAEAEARNIAAQHKRALIITGDDATQLRVEQAIRTNAIVYFAGHGIAGRTPADAALILADGTLSAFEIARQRLTSTHLAVLTACRSAAPGSRGDGPESIASAFLIAGVPTVVASAWPVADDSASTFAAAFHRALLGLGDAALALRESVVVRDTAGRPRSPAAWAVFSVTGGSPALVAGERRVASAPQKERKR